jgi:hypothetical protein
MPVFGTILRSLVIGCALVSSAFAEPPPPPPPPPPSDLPASLDGYSTASIWNSYALWVGQRMGEARASAIDIAPPPASLGAEFVRSIDGPRVRAFVPEPGGDLYGADARFDRWCRHRRDQQPECVWLGRVARSKDDVQMPFVRANFDLESAVRFLRANAMTPEMVTGWPPRSFGLPNPLDRGPLPYVDLVQATENECANVGVALENARRAQEQLVVSRTAPRERRAANPPPVHAGSMEITFPHWFVRNRSDDEVADADIVVRGYGPGALVVPLAQSMFEPLDSCAQAQHLK